MTAKDLPDYAGGNSLGILGATMYESDLQRYVTEAADTFGWQWWRDNDSRKNKRGLPDLILFGHGRVLWVELKRQSGRLTKAQEGFRDALLENGAEWFCWKPSDWLSGAIERELRTYRDPPQKDGDDGQAGVEGDRAGAGSGEGATQGSNGGKERRDVPPKDGARLARAR